MAESYFGDQGFAGFVESNYGPLDFQGRAVDGLYIGEQSMPIEIPDPSEVVSRDDAMTETWSESYFGFQLPDNGSAGLGTASPIEEETGKIPTCSEAIIKGYLLPNEEGDLSSISNAHQLTVEHTVPDSYDTYHAPEDRNSLSSDNYSMIGGKITMRYSTSGVDLWPKGMSLEDMSDVNRLLPNLPLQRGDRLYTNAAIVLLIPSRRKIRELSARLNTQVQSDPKRPKSELGVDYKARKLFGRENLEMALPQAGPLGNACGCADQWMADNLLWRLTGRQILCMVNDLSSNRHFR